uniref:Envelope glycoprotein n=1 Tax=Callithrix jacchus TaxID=9483 RepID=A0A8I3X5S6_CALJA
MSGWDMGNIFTIQRITLPRPNCPIGPIAQVIQQQEAPLKIQSPLIQIINTPSQQSSPTTPSRLEEDATLLNLLSLAHHLLNKSNPDLGKDCWLCLNPQPSFYTGLASQLPANLSNSSCSQSTLHLTLGDIEGYGHCYHSPNYTLAGSPYGHYCNVSHNVTFNGKNLHYQAPDTTWLACTFGLTNCMSTYQFNSSAPILCTPVHILPRVDIYDGQQGLNLLAPSDIITAQWKRVPIVIPLLVGLGIAGSTAVGISALITGDQNFKTLSQHIDTDLSHLENSISQLTDQVESLAGMILQNRRGLDLLFLKQGGLYVALNEQCCFYANRSRLIRESLSLVRQNLETRKQLREALESWYQKMFSWFPWLTSLLTGLVGPLALLLLGLMFGPCLLNRLFKFIKSRVDSIKLMILRSQYESLEQTNNINQLEESMI